MAKRTLDVLFSVTALAAGAPLLVLAAAAIRATSPGPVVYRQQRVGWRGRGFILYKLRTMPEGAELMTGPVMADLDDARTTAVGRLLRRTHFDEWPQFYNVLRGDMSVVGPRPERPHFVAQYQAAAPDYDRRHAVLPGLTGLAQVSSDQPANVNEKLRYDLAYVDRQSLWLDLLIVARTPFAIVRHVVGQQLPEQRG